MDDIRYDGLYFEDYMLFRESQLAYNTDSVPLILRDNALFDAVRQAISKIRPDWDINVLYRRGAEARMGLGPSRQFEVDVAKHYSPEKSPEEIAQDVVADMLSKGADEYTPINYQSSVPDQYTDFLTRYRA